MGLGGGKVKRKIGKDPNNTKWSRNADSFGQKILRSQGWEPGQYLGAQDAAHAEFHTAANASHIRVLLKDNNFGLGAKRNQNDECTGLDVFKDLLGRLNGKSEAAIETEKKARDDTRMTHYVLRKFGPMRFVEGGLLVGDKLEELVKDTKSPAETPADSVEASSVETDDAPHEKPKKEKKSKKRKAEDDALPADEERALRKEKKRLKKERIERAAVTTDEAVVEVGFNVAEAISTPKEDRSASPEVKSKNTKTKKEKKEKRDKKDKKDKKRQKNKEAAADSDCDQASQADTPSSTRDPDATSSANSKSEQPAATVRNIARKRFIAHKRLAFQDQAALNQIFMIKAT